MESSEVIGCLNAATDVLGDKWTPRLLCHFFTSKSLRFCELQDKTTGINPRTLSARLVMLEERGIIEKIGDGRHEYRLTQKGHDFLPVLRHMETWSTKYSLEHSANIQKQSVASNI